MIPPSADRGHLFPGFRVNDPQNRIAFFATSSTPRGEELLPAATTYRPESKAKSVTSVVTSDSPLAVVSAAQIILLVIVGIRRPLDLRLRMIFQFLHHDFDRLLQLRILSLPPGRRFEIDFHIGAMR